LGKGYFSTESFDKQTENHNKFFKLAVKLPKPIPIREKLFQKKEISKYNYSPRGFLIGYIYYYVCEKEELLKSLDFASLSKISSFKYASKIGVIKTIAIDDEYQGLGIGTELCYVAIQDLIMDNVDIIICIAWKTNKGINISGILKKFEFNEAFTVNNYWYEDSIRENFFCPICGEPPCTCEAVVFYTIPTKKIQIIKLYQLN